MRRCGKTITSLRKVKQLVRRTRIIHSKTFTCLFVSSLFLLCAIPLTSSSLAGQRRPARRGTGVKTAAIDYSNFSHNTKKHQGACDTCHKIPTKSWQKLSAYPDVKDYPGHGACVSCHRVQFFKGPRPPICSVCHTKTSPRDEVRFPFRNPSSARQFTIEFPHDRHQDVIGLLNRAPALQLMRAFAHSTGAPDERTSTYNNCSICHSERTLPTAPAKGWPDAFQPKAETFKSVPAGHDSCFNCHWKSQQPIAQNCTGCHKLGAASALAADAPTRISLKFMHEGGGEKKVHVAECTTCHINITKSVTLRGLKPDVPITSCTECHNKEGLRQDVSKELAAIDKNNAFVCVYCHTSNVGAQDPPTSHYLVAERPPLKRKEIK